MTKAKIIAALAVVNEIRAAIMLPLTIAAFPWMVATLTKVFIAAAVVFILNVVL